LSLISWKIKGICSELAQRPTTKPGQRAGKVAYHTETGAVFKPLGDGNF
jgi:hypothetical protein